MQTANPSALSNVHISLHISLGREEECVSSVNFQVQRKVVRVCTCMFLRAKKRTESRKKKESMRHIWGVQQQYIIGSSSRGRRAQAGSTQACTQTGMQEGRHAACACPNGTLEVGDPLRARDLET